jgi:DNA-binding transcriptional ArsR family regulator
MLDRIITSQTRRSILALFFQSPTESYYLREIVRATGEEVNAVKRELDILTECRLLSSERRLNKIFFTLNKGYPYYEDFLRIFAKDVPLARRIRESQPHLGRLKFVALSLKYVKRQEIRPDELYLLAVGTIVVPEMAHIVEECEKDYGMAINYTVLTEDELSFRKRSNDPFVWKFLKMPKVMIIGSEEELVK